MKILIVGSDYKWSIERSYLKYLNQQNTNTKLFPAQNILIDYLNKNIIHKIIHKINLAPIYKKINLEFKHYVEEFKPDVLWIFKGMEIFPESLLWAKERKIKLVNYNPDNPFIFSGKGSGNKNVTNSFNLFDLHLTYSIDILTEIKKKIGSKAELLPFGYDLTEAPFNIQDQAEEVNKLCFVGNPDNQRLSFIKQLVKHGISIDIFGIDWDKLITHPLVQLHGPVFKQDFWRILRTYRVQVNILRTHNLTSHNMRSFEIPSVGGIQLAPATIDHNEFYKDGKEIFLYNSFSEFIEKKDYLLNCSRENVNEYRKAARIKSMPYSYLNRSREVLTYFNKHF